MSQTSQIFMTTFKKGYLDIQSSRVFMVKMVNSESIIEQASKRDAKEFLELTGGSE